MFLRFRLRRVNRRIVRLGGRQVRCQARAAALSKCLQFRDYQRDLFEEAMKTGNTAFLRFRLRRAVRCILRYQRRKARLHARYATLGDRQRDLTYKRRFFESKSKDIAYATTFRGWLRATFRRPTPTLFVSTRNEKPVVNPERVPPAEWPKKS